ncbi:MAG: ABC transporter substrate-binding protein [Candidatus Hodarchaeota archaeon]
MIPIRGSVHQSPEPLFFVHILAPTSSVRLQHYQMIESNFPKIGIDTELDLISWSALGPRASDLEVGPYDEGGYDICFFGMTLGAPTSHPGAFMSVVYAADAIPPLGYNAMYWAPDPNNTHGWMDYRAAEQDKIIKDVNKELNLTKATEMLKDWSKIYYDAMPNIMIFSEVEVHALSTGLYGYDPVAQPFTLEDIWMTNDYTGSAGTVVFGSSSQGSSFLPHIICDVYSEYLIPDVFEGLLGLTASVDTVLPVGTDRAAWMQERFGTTEYLSRYSRIGTSLGMYSPDDQGNEGLNWSIQIRDDVYWHDGHQLDAWDVVFSYQTFMIPSVRTHEYSSLIFAFGHDDDPSNFTGKTKAHGNYSFYARDIDGDEFYETVDFLFNVTFAPWMADYTGYSLLPEHILGDPTNHGFFGFDKAEYDSTHDLSNYTFDPSLWNVAPTAWSSHSYNTGVPTDPGGYTGPIGTGPYYFESYDQITGKGTVKKWTDKQWNGSTWVTASGDGSGYRDQAKITEAPDTGIIIVTSLANGLSDMKVGDVNILDTQFTMGTILDELQAHPAIQATLTTGSVWQALYMNPKFTAKTQLSDTDRCLNRKGVRHAISHIIPREKISNDTFKGLVMPIFSPIPLTSWAAIPPDEFLQWKREYQGPGGYKIERDTTTPYDDYNITRALNYMSSEGYDMRPWSGPYPGTSCFTDEVVYCSLPDFLTSFPPTSLTTTTEAQRTTPIDLLPILQILEICTVLLFIVTLVIIIRRQQLN